MNSDSKPEPKVVHRPPPPGAQAGVDEAMIRTLVDAFYARIRADDVLGPIFEREISDWDRTSTRCTTSGRRWC